MENTTTEGDLSIPEFLKRDPSQITTLPKVVRRTREKKIPYPKDGYKCHGMRAKARARHKEKLRRRAERMRRLSSK